MAIKKASRRGSKRGKKVGLILSKDTVSTNLSEDDLTTFLGYVSAGEGKKADVLRTLIHEGIVARELTRNGHREADSKIKRIHVEAVESGTQGLAEKVDEALAILRKLGVGFEKLLGGSNVNFGLLFELLILSEGVSSMVVNDLTRPSMLAKAKMEKKKPEDVEITLAGLKELFEERASEKVERARRAIKPSATGLADAA